MDPKVVSALVRAEEWEALKSYVGEFDPSSGDDDDKDEYKPRGKGLTLYFNDIVFAVEKFSEEHLREVVEVDLSTKSLDRDGACPISKDNLSVILRFFQENELPHLVTLRVDNRPNANDVLQSIFGSAETKKSFFSLTEISAINKNLEEDGDSLSKDTIDCIFRHFEDYTHFIRAQESISSYWIHRVCVEGYVAKLYINMNTARMGTYLPWFAGDYRDGRRISENKQFKCHYNQKRPPSGDNVRLYIIIEVSH